MGIDFPPQQSFDLGNAIAIRQTIDDAVALAAKNDLTTAYNDAAGRTPAIDKTSQDLGGQTLVGGVYRAASSMSLTGTLTLDAQGNPRQVFIFKAGSTLITASSSRVRLIGGAQACNVFWQVGSSATLGTSTRFKGTIMALTSISLNTKAQVEGRVLARNGQVSLQNNLITRPGCDTTTTPSPSSSPSPSLTPGAWPSIDEDRGSGGTPSTPTASDSTPGGGSGGGAGGSGGSGGFIPVGRPDTGALPPAPTSAADTAMLRTWLTAGAALLLVALVVTGGSQRRRTWLARQK